MKEMKVWVITFNNNKIWIKNIWIVNSNKTPQTLAYHCKQKFWKRFIIKCDNKIYYSK